MTQYTVFGHEQNWARLLEAVARDRLPHALMFAGPMGIGKSLIAHKFAARFLCLNAQTAPCGTCVRCIQFAARSHPDCMSVALIPGKKEIGVDLIRQVKRFMQVRAIFGRRKIALIEDAERLSIAAQNAILKTLEEPPPDSLLVLITASPHALLPTVRSRCRLMMFHPLTAAQVQDAVVRNAGIETGMAPTLAALAQGSPGRALQLHNLVEGDTVRTLRQRLAELDVDRYVTVVGLAKALGRTEHEMTTRLELLQSWYRDAAVRAVQGDDAESGDVPLRGLSAQQATRGAAALAEALSALQRRNPNRPLLAEGLALQLARS